MARRIRLDVNGETRRVEVEDGEPLLYVLRNQLELNGPRFGCGLAQCGSCAVLIDGVAMRSCVLPATAVDSKRVTTLEGLGTAANPSPVQQAFIDEQAMQCGYCSNGMIIAATALLETNPKPSRSDVVEALDGTLCRCGSHNRVVRAVLRAAQRAIERLDDVAAARLGIR
ncbi:MAG: (2Fe-2S)-binding protein, partial [Pseudomonadota bacterium]